MTDEMRDAVKQGYEDGDWPGDISGDRELRPYEQEMLSELRSHLSEDPSVLDIGCGTGLPFDRWLLEQGCDVTGIDVVAENLAVARDQLPSGTFKQADFSELSYDGVFDAVVSFYAIFHIPRDEHAALFERMRSWITDEGYLLVTLADAEMERFSREFLGAEMVWSQYRPEKTVELLEDAGFSVMRRVEEHREDEDEHHIWVLAEAV